jgi:hypothetical protein
MAHPLLPVRLLDLTPARITTWMQDNNARGATQAAKIFRLVRAFLGWCAERPEYAGLVHADACRTSEVRDQVQAVKTKGDSLRREQLSLWFEQVRQLPNPVHFRLPAMSAAFDRPAPRGTGRPANGPTWISNGSP